MANSLQRNSKKTESWPKIRYSQREKAWMVDARTKDGGSRKFFQNRLEANTFAQQCRIARGNVGTSAFGNAELAKYGKNVQQAIEFYLEYLRRRAKSAQVVDSVEELIAFKISTGRSARYCNDLRLRLTRFARDFGNVTISNIGAKEIDYWLTQLALAPSTRNTFRRDIRTLFSFCEKRGYCEGNEAKKTDLAMNVGKPAGILTPIQAKNLLDNCDHSIIPYCAISLFAGLRSAEAQKLDWAEIDFESGHIEVTAEKSKTSRRRLVPISGNLVAWIMPCSKVSGSVTPVGLRNRFDAARNKAGISDWPQNALRHSYGSYRLAHCHDVARVALEMGNSAQMIFAHYRELVKPKQAEEFWRILP